MPKSKLTSQRGFALLELAITIVISAIVILGVAVVLVSNQSAWNHMYNKAHSDVVTDGFVAKNTFDTLIRKASKENFLINDAGNLLEIYYYSDEDSASVDRYARFYELNGCLILEHGKYEPRETLTVQTICENVSNCFFTRAGRSAQMILTLDNSSQTTIVSASAVMHNE
jgi:competence protein ComGC